MTDQQVFEQLKDFFENRTACRLASEPLGKNVEIGIVINDKTECAFFKKDGVPKFEMRPAKSPDVIFYLGPDAVAPIVNSETDDVGELGIVIAKQYLAGTVKMKVKGSMFSLLTNGYLGVIKAGGMSFAKFLGSHGLSGLGKIKDFIGTMRSK
jgi:hypothetical protein